MLPVSSVMREGLETSDINGNAATPEGEHLDEKPCKQEFVEECNHRMKQEPQDEYCGSDDCSEPSPNVFNE